jgi:NitT/TauT family transport system substrate-binding protein
MEQTRRSFLASLSTAGALGLIGSDTASAQHAPLETTTIRLVKNAGICLAPQYVADELLRAEGFTEYSARHDVAGRHGGGDRTR